MALWAAYHNFSQYSIIPYLFTVKFEQVHLSIWQCVLIMTFCIYPKYCNTLTPYAPVIDFPERKGDRDTLGIRQPNNPNPWEFDRTLRHWGSVSDTFTEEITCEFYAHLRDFLHKTVTHGEEIWCSMFKDVWFPKVFLSSPLSQMCITILLLKFEPLHLSICRCV